MSNHLHKNTQYMVRVLQQNPEVHHKLFSLKTKPLYPKFGLGVNKYHLVPTYQISGRLNQIQAESAVRI